MSRTWRGYPTGKFTVTAVFPASMWINDDLYPEYSTISAPQAGARGYDAYNISLHPGWSSYSYLVEAVSGTNTDFCTIQTENYDSSGDLVSFGDELSVAPSGHVAFPVSDTGSSGALTSGGYFGIAVAYGNNFGAVELRVTVTPNVENVSLPAVSRAGGRAQTVGVATLTPVPQPGYGTIIGHYGMPAHGGRPGGLRAPRRPIRELSPRRWLT